VATSWILVQLQSWLSLCISYDLDAAGGWTLLADVYHAGNSEQWVGDWMKERKNREQVCIAKGTTVFSFFEY